MSTPSAPDRRCVLVAHPGAELYGSDRVMVESAVAFAHHGWRVVVTVPAPGPLVDDLARRGIEVRIMAAPVLRKAYLRGAGPLLLLAETVRSLPAGVRMLRDTRPDAIYVSTLTLPTWLVLAALLRIPAMCHVHEAESTIHRVLRVALALPLVLARRVVVNSRFSTAVLARAIPSIERRCHVVYNGVPGPGSVVPPRESLDGGVRLLYLGRISERKGVLDAVDAVACLRERGQEATLDIVGGVFPGYEWVDEQLRDRIRRLDLGERVRRHGFRTEIWEHLAAADVLLVPSRMDEPFGNTAVEGALAARPVVASDRGGLVEATAGLHSARLVPPGDPGAIADAVIALARAWPASRESAIGDSIRAAARHSPATYREAVAGELEAMLGLRTSR